MTVIKSSILLLMLLFIGCSSVPVKQDIDPLDESIEDLFQEENGCQGS